MNIKADLKVLYIHQYFATRDSATGTRSYEFARLLTKKGHKITVLTGTSQIESIANKQKKNRETYWVDGIKIVAIKNAYSNHFGKIRRILSFLFFLIQALFFPIKKNEYDVIYATSTPLTIAIPALFLSWRSKTPFVFEVRDLWPEAPIQLGVIKSKFIINMLKWLEKKVYDKAAHIVALSPGMKEGIIHTGVKNNKVTIVPNSSDLDLFQGNNIRNEVIEHFDLKDKFILVHGGSMGVINGLDYVVKAAKILKEQNIDDISIVLTGDGGNRENLEIFCKKHNLSNVIFTGKLSRSHMPEILALADITITSVKDVPILATSSPNKFFDSLAAGKAVIVNTNGWTKDILIENECGFYVDPNDPTSLSDLLIKLQSNPMILEKMGKNARLLAENVFDRNKLVQVLESILIENSKSKVNKKDLIRRNII